MRHVFIAPPGIHSPRWQEAFTDSIRVDKPFEAADTLIAEADCIWWLVESGGDMAGLTLVASMGRKTIAMTLAESADQARASLEAGASGYVHYLAVPQVLEQAAQVVSAGGMWLGADLMRQLILATRSPSPVVRVSPRQAADLSILTTRELSVARLVAAGKTNKEIARDLVITERTVKAHLGSIFEKLKVRDRLHLALVLATHS